MVMPNHGLLIDYEFCTGCHSCEMACKVEKGLPEGEWGIRVSQQGPQRIAEDVWDYFFVPIPTALCDLCAERVKEGRLPTCVHHCQALVMEYGTVEELSQKLIEKPKQVLFVPCAD